MDSEAQAQREDRYLTPGDVSELLQIPRGTVYVLARKGTLPSFKVGKAIRFRARDLDSALRALQRVPVGQ